MIGETKRFGGFDNANIRVVDVTVQLQVKELTPAANVTSLEDGSFAPDRRPGSGSNGPQTAQSAGVYRRGHQHGRLGTPE